MFFGKFVTKESLNVPNDTHSSMSQERRTSIAGRVREYLSNKPYVLEAMERDIVNTSSLSRKIGEELRIDAEGAIKAALIRFSKVVQEHKTRREQRVNNILKTSRITISDGVNVVVSTRPLALEARISMELGQTNVYLVDELKGIPKENSLSVLNENCGMITIGSPLEIEETPGVVAHLTSLLAEQNINVIEFVSCYTHTVFVINQEDISRVYEILRKAVGPKANQILRTDINFKRKRGIVREK